MKQKREKIVFFSDRAVPDRKKRHRSPVTGAQKTRQYHLGDISESTNNELFRNNEAVSKVFLRQFFFCKTFGVIRIILYIYT
jgi:hypothetical protein